MRETLDPIYLRDRLSRAEAEKAYAGLLVTAVGRHR